MPDPLFELNSRVRMGTDYYTVAKTQPVEGGHEYQLTDDDGVTVPTWHPEEELSQETPSEGSGAAAIDMNPNSRRPPRLY